MTINFRCMDKSGVNIWKTSFSFHKIKKKGQITEGFGLSCRTTLFD